MQGDKDQPWNKLSINKKKALSVNNFMKIKELGSGKYGQVSLVQYAPSYLDRKALDLSAR